MTQSLAAVFDGTAGKLTLRRFTLPSPGRGELIVKILGCTLCGSDLHTFHGRRSAPVPTILGHEYVGEIIQIGGDEPIADLAGQTLAIGHKVTWALVASCGSCFFCQHDLPQKCRHGTKYGHEALRGGRELLGGLAEHCLLVRGSAIVRIPDELPLEVACPASCATATVAAALEAAGDLAGVSVCIFGAGMLGLTAAAMARSRGAAEVVCVDPDTERVKRAMRFGATAVAHPDTLPQLREQFTHERGFDVIIELSGSPAAFDAAWPMLRIGGCLVLVGTVFPTRPVQIEPEQIVRRQITIRGIHNYMPRHLLAAVQFLAREQHVWPFHELVGAWLPLTKVADAFEQAAQPGAGRIGIRP